MPLSWPSWLVSGSPSGKSLSSFVSISIAQLKAIRSLVNTPIVVYLAGVDRENGGIVGTPVLYGAWNVSPFRPCPASVAKAEDSCCPFLLKMMYSISQLVFPILAGNVLDTAGNTRGWMIILSVLCGTGAACFVTVLRYMRLSGTNPARS